MIEDRIDCEFLTSDQSLRDAITPAHCLEHPAVAHGEHSSPAAPVARLEKCRSRVRCWRDR
jgi:hypothetical protein